MPSFTNPETTTYQVSLTSCSCPDFVHRREERGEKCKHILALEENLGECLLLTD
jgi:predicted nucleic acid-binding Zn finger protein